MDNFIRSNPSPIDFFFFFLLLPATQSYSTSSMAVVLPTTPYSSSSASSRSNASHHHHQPGRLAEPDHAVDGSMYVYLYVYISIDALRYTSREYPHMMYRRVPWLSSDGHLVPSTHHLPSFSVLWLDPKNKKISSRPSPISTISSSTNPSTNLDIKPSTHSSSHQERILSSQSVLEYRASKLRN